MDQQFRILAEATRGGRSGCVRASKPVETEGFEGFHTEGFEGFHTEGFEGFHTEGFSFKDLGKKIEGGLQTAGAGIKDAGQKAGAGIKDVGQKAGAGLKGFGQKVGSAIKNGALKVWDFLKKLGLWIKIVLGVVCLCSCCLCVGTRFMK